MKKVAPEGEVLRDLEDLDSKHQLRWLQEGTGVTRFIVCISEDSTTCTVAHAPDTLPHP